MQKAPVASVSAGPVTPTVMGPEKDMKDVYIMSGLVFFLAVVVSAFWYYSQADEAAHSNPSAEALNSSQVSQVLKDSTDHAPVSASIPTTHVDTAPLAIRSTDILHDDIHFEIGRKGLTDDGKAALQRHAEFLKSERDWGHPAPGLYRSTGFEKLQQDPGHEARRDRQTTLDRAGCAGVVDPHREPG
jgi:peptidoglycan-associated lipoprotein